MSGYNFKYARILDNNMLDDATVTVSATGGFAFANALDLANRNTEFRPSSNTFTIQIDLKANKHVSFMAILGPSDALFGISQDATITVKGNMINLFTGGEAVNETVTVDELGAFLNLATEAEPFGPELRYWEIDIDDSLNPDPVKINYIYLGDHVQFIHNIENGFNFQAIDLTRKSFSNTGKTFTNRKPQQRYFSGYGVSFIRSADRITLLNTIQTIGTHTPFLFALDPTEKQIEHDFSVTPVYFDRQVPSFSHVRLDYFNIGFNLREVL